MRALLANRGLEDQPVKGVYFFPGEGDTDILWTTHPTDPRDRRWNSEPDTRGWVLDRMVDAHVNTVVASYWGAMTQWSPMTLDDGSWRGLLDGIDSRPLTVLPALEGGSDPGRPDLPQWEFRRDFPFDPVTGELAPGLIRRIGEIIDLFADRSGLWAQLCDRSGNPRYAINIIHACSDVLPPGEDPDGRFADALDQVADTVRDRFGCEIGFTLDATPGAHTLTPGGSGPHLARASSVLALQGFASEIFSGVVRNGPPCDAPDWRDCRPHDNNRDALPFMAQWKAESITAWADSGVPVVLDVTNGFDGRIVWRAGGAGFWGDNADYTDDRWRNWMSALKGPNISGITFDTWNGYTEGYAAVPSTEHGETVYRWLQDLLAPDPRSVDHTHYVDGVAAHRVAGAIGEKWIQLGGDRGFGAPVTEESPSARGRTQSFSDGKDIYWGPDTGAHELHGLIGATYRKVGGDASSLGLPLSDEEPWGAGRRSMTLAVSSAVSLGTPRMRWCTPTT